MGISKLIAVIATLTGRAMRADAEAKHFATSNALSASQSNFHAGRREGYLQAIALLSGNEVKEVREAVLGKTAMSEERVPKSPSMHYPYWDAM